MTQLIIDGELRDSPFEAVTADTADPSASNVMLPLSVWLEHRDSLAGRNDIGLWLEPDDEVEAIADVITQFPVIGLNFPTFFDGRCLSTANLLRRKYAFEGELRAIGDVRRDQLEQMKRCGINAFALADGQDATAAIEALKGFTYAYQATIQDQEPLFRKR